MMLDELFPVGIASAQPGWRAVYLNAGTTDVLPLAGWVLVERWRQTSLESLASKETATIQGYVVVNGRVRLAEEDATFWCYLAPEDEAPDKEDVQLEMRLRRIKSTRMQPAGPPL